LLQVPYLAKKAFKISEDYTAPAGTMVIPSFWNSLHDDTVYPKPDEFIPERWMPLPEGGVPLAEQSPQNYMVWGSGPHKVSTVISRTRVASADMQHVSLVYWSSIRINASGRRYR
jgi:hypothetical protein